MRLSSQWALHGSIRRSLALLVLLLAAAPAVPAQAAKQGGGRLVLASPTVRATILLSQDPAPLERRAARDLQTYIRRMSGVELPIAEGDAQDRGSGDAPAIVVGAAALRLRPQLQARLKGLVKSQPMFRADGIVLQRVGNSLYVAGANERSHYFAVAELLRRWGVRWFMPGPFGESVPELSELSVDDLDYAYAPPFEVRTFWVSWLGSTEGIDDFQLRNMMTDRAELPPTGHALNQFLPQGPALALSAPETAAHVADRVAPAYAQGRSVSLSIEDQLYTPSAPADQRLLHLQWDKYMQTWSVADLMLTLYNNVARRLKAQHPDSRAYLGFLAYANMTLPPIEGQKAAPGLYAELAPIDFDPIHGMDDSRSAPKQELKDILDRWSQVMDRRLVIYDYDQGMLVWRDLPNPSHIAFQQDVQHYRRAGILGVNTESRMALATTFTNLYMRARLLWNPDEDIGALLNDFYARFYGPASAPMQAYWSRIFDAWGGTEVTEHEFFVAPAIYTPALLRELSPLVAAAEAAVAAPGIADAYRRRVRFTRLSYELMENYMAMVQAAGSEVDYRTAIARGRAGLAARAELARMDPRFTSTRLEEGPAFWPGEVAYYEELLARTEGQRGRLVRRLPLHWAARLDRRGLGTELGWASEDLPSAMEAGQAAGPTAMGKAMNRGWTWLRSDLYAEAQTGSLGAPGDIWYRADIDLSEAEIRSPLAMMFPGLFNACDLFWNGQFVAHRAQQRLWWFNDYRFGWDVELPPARQGRNKVALRCATSPHLSGLFRRSFLYAR